MRFCSLLCSPTRPRPVGRLFPGAWLPLSKLGFAFFLLSTPLGADSSRGMPLNPSLRKAPPPLPLAQHLPYGHSGVSHGRLTISVFPELRDSWSAGQNLLREHSSVRDTL